MSAMDNMIKTDRDGNLQVPNFPTIPYIEGDGVGPEIISVTRPVIDAAVHKAYGDDRKIQWYEVLAGTKSYQTRGVYLPADTMQALKQFKVAIKGPLSTPPVNGMRNLNVVIRQELDLYACVRPVSHIPGVPCPVKRPQDVDIVVFRENTEDLYKGMEWAAGSKEAEQLSAILEKQFDLSLAPQSAIGLKVMTEEGCKRLVRAAIEYALEFGRESVTLVHKGNIMRHTEGAFRDWGYEVATEEFPRQVAREGENTKGRLLIKDRMADMMFSDVLIRPYKYDVLAMPNVNGDYFSDALAAQIGGMGMAGGANIGHGVAVFESTHRAMPDLTGRDVANPCSAILAGAMMLDYLGWPQAAELVREALENAITARCVTRDLAKQTTNAKEHSCSAFGRVVVAYM